MTNKDNCSKINRFSKFATYLSTGLAILILAGCAGTPGRTASGVSKTPESDPSSSENKDYSQPENKEIDYLPEIPLDEDTGVDIGKNPAPSNNGLVQSRFDKSLEFYQTAQEHWQRGEIESALDALDKAYAIILNTKTDDTPQFIQQKDDLRFMISKRILEIYASRHTTVKGNHDAIPIAMNRHVQKELDHFTKGNARVFFANSYQRAGVYRPYIVEELRKAGLPEELSWLPLIESGFKTKALSRARALGMWQFIASTGHKFGLKRDRYIDERLDPYKSTLAAIEYLKELHDIFGDWKTVLAAYNCGEGRVLREIRKQNINYLDDFWDLYERLPYETARYVPKFIATLEIVNNLEKYGFDGIVPDQPLAFETILIDRQSTLKDIAETIGIEGAVLEELNPELRYKVLPDEEYALRLPGNMKEILLAKIDDIPENQQNPHNITHHRVRRGETLSTIARRYRTTVQKIAWYNNISRDNYIVAGQLLKIPQSGEFVARPKTSASPKLISYRVRRGDSLWLLAKRYNTTTKKIQDINSLRSVNLHIGQALKIPINSQEMAVYHVKPGDSPYTIARQHNMNLDDLLNLNHLSKNSRIYPGQELYVK